MMKNNNSLTRVTKSSFLWNPNDFQEDEELEEMEDMNMLGRRIAKSRFIILPHSYSNIALKIFDGALISMLLFVSPFLFFINKETQSPI